ncbi:MAG: hypothetical protein OHK93_004156 [Ramalina farinacea]|uniref:ATP adenylyltransferase n=1 Tax=Ramalina farinacea TaxID=258253 RepID=A0AA43QG84_9LECA|nr:hypothetical protein [Ramalina farinacea]
METQDPTISDIPRPSSLHIGAVPPSHILDLNAYPVLRPSYLLLTNSSTHRQTSPLNVADVHAAWTAADRLESGSHGVKYMVIYNCGREAGCSRSHKHMQLFPCPPDFVLFPDRTPDECLKVPYVYELVRLDPSSSRADDTTLQIFTAYRTCLQRARAVLGIEEGEHVPHNVVLVREWILVIPRRKGRVGGVSANAAGMMGLVWVASEEELEEWSRRGGFRLLGELGIAVGRGHNQRKTDGPAIQPP